MEEQDLGLLTPDDSANSISIGQQAANKTKTIPSKIFIKLLVWNWTTPGMMENSYEWPPRSIRLEGGWRVDIFIHRDKAPHPCDPESVFDHREGLSSGF